MAGMCPFRDDSVTAGPGANFYPNDRINGGAPVPDPSVAEPPMPVLENAWIAHHDEAADEDHYSQAGDLFRLMDETQKTQLTTTIAGGLAYASNSAQARMLEQFKRADPDYAERILRLLDQHRKTA